MDGMQQRQNQIKTAITTFARASIPHKGHEKLFNAVNTIAEKENADPLIFLSYSFDAKRNPVPYDKKVDFLTSCGIKSIINNSKVRTIFDMLQYCNENNYEKVILVVGSDRVNELKERITPYTNSDSLPFEFEVRSAGNRKSLGGISGTKMREFVSNNDFESFKKWLPKKAKHEPTCRLWATARYNTFATL